MISINNVKIDKKWLKICNIKSMKIFFYFFISISLISAFGCRDSVPLDGYENGQGKNIFSNHDPGDEENSGGAWEISGAEERKDKHNPWFLGKMDVTYCVIVNSNDFGNLPIEHASSIIDESIEYWQNQIDKSYRTDRFPFDLDGVLNLSTTNFIFEDKCNKDTQIKFQFGHLTENQVKNKEYFLKPDMLGVSVRTDYDSQKLRGKGFVFIRPPRGHFSYNADKYYEDIWDIQDRMYLKFILTHEIGHLFGMHENRNNMPQQALVMSESIVEFFDKNIIDRFGVRISNDYDENNTVGESKHSAETMTKFLKKVFYGNYFHIDRSTIDHSDNVQKPKVKNIKSILNIEEHEKVSEIKYIKMKSNIADNLVHIYGSLNKYFPGYEVNADYNDGIFLGTLDLSVYSLRNYSVSPAIQMYLPVDQSVFKSDDFIYWMHDRSENPGSSSPYLTLIEYEHIKEIFGTLDLEHFGEEKKVHVITDGLSILSITELE